MKANVFLIIIAVVVVVALMIWGGWINFHKDQDSASIDIQTEEIEKDTEEAVDQAKDVSKDVIDESRDAINDAQEDDTDDRPDRDEPVTHPERRDSNPENAEDPLIPNA